MPLNDATSKIFKNKIKTTFKLDDIEESDDVLRAIGALQGKSTDPQLKSLPSISDQDKERFTKILKDLAIMTNTKEQDLVDHVKSLRPDLVKESYVSSYLAYFINPRSL